MDRRTEYRLEVVYKGTERVIDYKEDKEKRDNMFNEIKENLS